MTTKVPSPPVPTQIYAQFVFIISSITIVLRAVAIHQNRKVRVPFITQ